MVEERDKVSRITKLNKSLYFLLPMLNTTYSRHTDSIINCYLTDKKNRSKLDLYYLFILLRKDDDFLKNSKYFLESYNTQEDYIMYVFRIDKELEEDYLKFILGKYSEFSSNYKKQIVKFLPENYQKTNVFKVIMKSQELKKKIEEKVGCSIGEQEVMSIPELDEENYD